MQTYHILSASQFKNKDLDKIFKLTTLIKNGKYHKQALHGKIISTLFYEPSTRTRLSFESAMLRLGGSVISTESAKQFSSVAKGETLEDTIRIIESYCDIIALRHSEKGAADQAAKVASIPIINAGDGNGEHPTQALLDLYTITSKLNRHEFTIVMAGDLSNYRSVHSLTYLLSNYPKIKIIYVSPASLGIPNEFRAYLKTHGVIYEETDDFKSSIKIADIIYMTRIPKEYLNPKDYKMYSGQYILDKKMLALIKKDAYIMHPLPRVGEISPEIDNDKRAIYFEQARNGLYIRMAILLLIFDKI